MGVGMRWYLSNSPITTTLLKKGNEKLPTSIPDASLLCLGEIRDICNCIQRVYSSHIALLR